MEIDDFYKRARVLGIQDVVAKSEVKFDIDRFVKKFQGMVFLDVGAGANLLSTQFSQSDSLTIGIDRIIPNTNHNNFVNADAYSIPLAAACVTNICFSKVMSLLNIRLAFKEVKRVLKPNGQLLIREHFYSNDWDGLMQVFETECMSVTQRRQVLCHKEAEFDTINNFCNSILHYGNLFGFYDCKFHCIDGTLTFNSYEELKRSFTNYSPMYYLFSNLEEKQQSEVDEILDGVLMSWFGSSYRVVRDDLLVELTNG